MTILERQWNIFDYFTKYFDIDNQNVGPGPSLERNLAFGTESKIDALIDAVEMFDVST